MHLKNNKKLLENNIKKDYKNWKRKDNQLKKIKHKQININSYY